jgi:nitrogen fixation protein FixH
MSQQKDLSARHARRWISLIVGLFLVAGAFNAVLLVKATSDPSFAVVPDYYEKALRWDEKLAQDRKNLELGWQLSLELSRAPGSRGEVEILARLQDRQGRALAGAALELSALHKARAARVLQATLEDGGDGSYRGRLPLSRPGLWELSLVAQRGDERFTRLLVRDLPSQLQEAPAGPGQVPGQAVGLRPVLGAGERVP